MVFEQYQFLRYYIPGSLFIIYTSVLILPILDSTVFSYFKSHPETLLGVVGGVFGASLAFGYIIYTFYDTICYNKIGMDENKRPLLGYLKEKLFDYYISACKVKMSELDEAQKTEYKNEWNKKWDMVENRPIKKALIETLYLNNQTCQESFQQTLGGWMSHFNARVVCYFWVPFLAWISFEVLVVLDYFGVLDNGLGYKLFSFPFPPVYWYVSCAFIMSLISIMLWIGSRNPLNETFQLEYLIIRQTITNNPTLFKTVSTQAVKQMNNNAKNNN